MNKQDKLNKIDQIIKDGLTAASTNEVLQLIGAQTMDEECLADLKLYSDFLPMAKEDPYTEEQRYLHFL